MNTATTSKTLLDDWRDRREFLESQGGTGPRHELHVKLLDYLIRRYGASAAAQLPARFPLERNLCWNDRRIVVHHHLGRGKIAGVESRQEAQQRIAGLVERLMSAECSEDDDDVTPAPSVHRRRWFLFRPRPSIWKLKLGWNVDSQIRQALAADSRLPRACVEHLVARLTDVSKEDTWALELFLQCRNRNILHYTIRAWLHRVAHEPLPSSITAALAARIRSSEHQPQAAELMRARLADDDLQIRLAATGMLAEIGSLDDIGLLSDLLALPATTAENPLERDALTSAMQTLAERNAS